MSTAVARAPESRAAAGSSSEDLQRNQVWWQQCTLVATVFKALVGNVIDRSADIGDVASKPEEGPLLSDLDDHVANRIVALLKSLDGWKADMSILQSVPIGKLLTRLRKSPNVRVANVCTEVVRKWKAELANGSQSPGPAAVGTSKSKVVKGEPPAEYKAAVLKMKSRDQLRALVEEWGRPLSSFSAGDTVHVYDKMQKGYKYRLKCAPGEGFDPRFTPEYTPAQMLAMGVFEGKYLNDCVWEFPKEWFDGKTMQRLSPGLPASGVNYFKIKSRSPLYEWHSKGWLPPDDPRGWFQWYCRYYMGRRQPAVDERQIGRWRSFARHAGQIRANCPGDLSKRTKQRQALLQWSYDPHI